MFHECVTYTLCVCVCVCVHTRMRTLSHGFVTLWTVAH